MKITIQDIRSRAEKQLREDSWPETEARLRGLGWAEDKILKAKDRTKRDKEKGDLRANRILAVNPESLSLPGTHGGNAHKPLYSEAAAAWFGFDAEIEWPLQVSIIKS